MNGGTNGGIGVGVTVGVGVGPPGGVGLNTDKVAGALTPIPWEEATDTAGLINVPFPVVTTFTLTRQLPLAATVPPVRLS
jgi:hypothetical protein